MFWRARSKIAGRLCLGQYNLANMSCLGHMTECANRLPEGEILTRQRFEIAFFELSHQVKQHGPNQGRLLLTDFIQGNYRIRHISPKLSDSTLIPNADLADLQEAPLRRQDREAPRDVLSR